MVPEPPGLESGNAPKLWPVKVCKSRVDPLSITSEPDLAFTAVTVTVWLRLLVAAPMKTGLPGPGKLTPAVVPAGTAVPLLLVVLQVVLVSQLPFVRL